MTFGKYKNWELSDIPTGYMQWCLANCERMNWNLKNEMSRIVGVNIERNRMKVVDIEDICLPWEVNK